MGRKESNKTNKQNQTYQIGIMARGQIRRLQDQYVWNARDDPTLVDLTSNVFVPCTNVNFIL